MVVNGLARTFGVFGSLPPGAAIRGGYWVIPITILLGLGTLVLTHRGAKKSLLWWRGRLEGARSEH